MATKYTCKECGCKDSFLVSPAPCPTPGGCPDPEPCSEIIDAQCVIYTGLDIVCDDDIVIETDTTLADALVDIVTYFCDNGGGGGTGPVGPVGPPGIQGTQGVAGPTGPQGTAGSAGGAGTTGATGPQGIQGVAGPVGPAGLNWQGSWSALGVYAPDDAVGYAGASWFCLNAVGPSASNPTIDPANWALLASEGAVGPAGPTGASGVAGAAGATGPQGLTGPAGIQGIQGITGPTGAQGPQGVQGIPGTGGSIFTYEIGQFINSEGGVVFHRWLSTTTYGAPQAGTIQNYLIIDLFDLAISAQWATNNVNIPNVESTNYGSVNTSNLISAGAGSGITPGTAAVLCASSTNNGFTDWYLPAIDELVKIFINRWEVAAGLSVVGGTQLAYNYYWSSTEYDGSSAWYLYFLNGSVNNWNGKGQAYHVRAVRRFSI